MWRGVTLSGRNCARDRTHARARRSRLFSCLPPHRCPKKPCAAASDSRREFFAVQGLRAGFAAAAAVEQSRGCQRRNQESFSAPIGGLGPQQRPQRGERSRMSPRDGGLARTEQRARRPAAAHWGRKVQNHLEVIILNRIWNLKTGTFVRKYQRPLRSLILKIWTYKPNL